MKEKDRRKVYVVHCESGVQQIIGISELLKFCEKNKDVKSIFEFTNKGVKFRYDLTKRLS